MDENKVIRPMDFVGQGGQSGRENEYNMDR